MLAIVPPEPASEPMPVRMNPPVPAVSRMIPVALPPIEEAQKIADEGLRNEVITFLTSQQESEAAPGSPDPALASAPQIEVVAKEAENKVDVLVDGQLFTSYLFPTTIQKPVG